MPLLKEEAYTIDDIYALPDGERAELIDGVLYDMASPETWHHQAESISVSQQDLSVLLIVILKNIKENARSMLHHLLFTWMKEVIPM